MKNKIRVAFFVYPSAFQNIGGGEILLLRTKEYVEKEGVYCKLFDTWNDKLSDFDVLHIIGAVKDCLGLMRTAKSKGLKVVLDPVFFSTFQRAAREQGNLLRKTDACLRHLTKVFFPYFPSDRRKMMFLADAVIPNSKAEEDQIARLFRVPREKMRMIPNCVDRAFEFHDKDMFVLKYGVSDFILSVGRIEPRKNQLNLIRAVKGFAKRLVLIGDPVSDYAEYYNKCRQEGRDTAIFINRIDHDDPMLKSAYGACACFVSQGWFETPGLAALEAGLAGTNVASTDKGCTIEYFRDLVEYFNPADLKGMRNAVEKSLYKDKDNLLKEHIKKEFLWEVAARKNIEIYTNLLQK